MSPAASPPREVELRIDSLATGGDGVGRLDGRPVFVPATAPGDRIRALVVEERPRYARGRLLEVLEAGPARRDPPCPVADRCGGCSWIHLDDVAQREARAEILRQTLRRIGGLDSVPPIEMLPSPRALGYRTRARLAIGTGSVGFRARASHEVVDVERCAVLDEATQAALEQVRRRSRDAPGGAGAREVAIRGHGDVLQIADRSYSVGAASFFQANASLWSAWLERVVEACGVGRSLVELYAGVGFYTAALCERFERVVAVERGDAASDARRNSTARVVHAAAEAWAPTQLARERPDVVLMNPPRAGCHKSVSDAIREARPGRIVYVSCDPSTLARDVARLGSDFRVVDVVCVDALPQTHHVEAICSLVSC